MPPYDGEQTGGTNSRVAAEAHHTLSPGWTPVRAFGRLDAVHALRKAAPPRLPCPAFSGALHARASVSTRPAGRAWADGLRCTGLDPLARACSLGRWASPPTPNRRAWARLPRRRRAAPCLWFRRGSPRHRADCLGTALLDGLRLDALPHSAALRPSGPQLHHPAFCSVATHIRRARAVARTDSLRQTVQSPFHNTVTEIRIVIVAIATRMQTCTVTRAIPCMRDKHDCVTFDLLLDEAAPATPRATKPSLGRPKKADALSDAERARRYRARKKARLAELRDVSKPVSSTIIELSALPPWKRKQGGS